MRRIRFTEYAVTAETEKTEGEETSKVESQETAMVKLGLTYVLTFSLYLFTLLYGASVMRSVLEEKTTRIVEVIISSIQPYQLLLGKIIGVCLVCLDYVLNLGRLCRSTIDKYQSYLGVIWDTGITPGTLWCYRYHQINGSISVSVLFDLFCLGLFSLLDPLCRCWRGMQQRRGSTTDRNSYRDDANYSFYADVWPLSRSRFHIDHSPIAYPTFLSPYYVHENQRAYPTVVGNSTQSHSDDCNNFRCNPGHG